MNMATTQGAAIASQAFLRTLPGLVKQLCIHGEQALKPQKVNGNFCPKGSSCEKGSYIDRNLQQLWSFNRSRVGSFM